MHLAGVVGYTALTAVAARDDNRRFNLSWFARL